MGFLPHIIHIMPTSPPKICNHPGCNTLTLGARCVSHRITRTSTTRHQKLYSNARWRRLRKVQLSREPLCRDCMKHGQITTANEVDHINPHDGDRKLMFDMANLQSLCKSCHSRKTMTETMGTGGGDNR